MGNSQTGESRVDARTCPQCGSAVVSGVRLLGMGTPGTAAAQVVFVLSCDEPGCAWQQEERVA